MMGKTQLKILGALLLQAAALVGICCLVFYKGPKVYLIILTLLLLGLWFQLYRWNLMAQDKMRYFIEGIRNQDHSLYFTESKGSASERALNKAFNTLKQMLQEVRKQSEVNEQYYLNIINQSTIGLIVRSDEDGIKLASNAVLRLTRLPSLYHLNQLDAVSPQLKKVIAEMKPGAQVVDSFTIYGKKEQLSIQASDFKQQDQDLVLLSIKNVHTEIDRSEVQSWIKLIKVLTHEIMNSLAPITSMSQTLEGLFSQSNWSSEDREMASQAVALIYEESEGLSTFVNNYRSLTLLPAVRYSAFSNIALMQKWKLLAQELLPSTIQLEVRSISHEEELWSDIQLLNRVALNILNNAVEALKGTDKPSVCIAYKGQGQIEISNNGPAISAELREHIWLPFFSSKVKGSGIGLSLCKQIMNQLNGSIEVESTAQYTCFRIQL